MRFLLVTAVALMALAGCSHVVRGNEFNMAAASAIRPGETTKDEAIAAIGVPVGFVSTQNGGLLVRWEETMGTGHRVGKTSSLAILFDKNDKMVRIVSGSKI